MKFIKRLRKRILAAALPLPPAPHDIPEELLTRLRHELAGALEEGMRTRHSGHREGAVAVFQMMLEVLDPEFYLGRLQHLRFYLSAPVGMLGTMVEDAPPGDPVRRRILHLFVDLYGRELQCGGCTHLLDTLPGLIRYLALPEERADLVAVARKWMPPYGDLERRWELEFWTRFLQDWYARDRADELMARPELRDLFHLHFHALFWEARLDEAIQLADRCLDDSVWEELDACAMEHLAEEGLLARVLDLLESRWGATDLTPARIVVLQEARAELRREQQSLLTAR